MERGEETDVELLIASSNIFGGQSVRGISWTAAK